MRTEIIAEALDRIESKIDSLLIQNENFKDLKESKIMSVRDIAEYYGVAQNSLYTRNRFMLPNFGLEEHKGDMKWSLKEVLEWNSRSVEERKNEFNNLPLE